MSMTKDSRAFNDMMEQARRDDELSHDEYLSEQYFRNSRKARFPADDEQVTPPKGTTPTTK